MSEQIVSIYTFELHQNSSKAEFLSESAKMDDILLKVDGFHYRSLTQTTEGLWQDIVYWESEEASKAVEGLEAKGAFKRFMAMINTSSVKHVKAVLHSSVFPAMPEESLVSAESA